MKHCLLVFAAVVALAIGVPASAQYIFLDMNGSTTCTSADILSASTTSIDVWLYTNNNGDGSGAVCPTGQSLTINSYAFILQSSGSGTVGYGTWTDNMGFTIPGGGAQAGTDFWVGRASGTPLSAGHYKLGTLAITVTGNPVLSLRTSTTIDGTAFTGFGSACPGIDFDNTLKLGSDFTSACGTSSGIPVQQTTWGKIKNLYRQ